MPIASLPAPPYYAVIFANMLGADRAGYDEMATAMAQTAALQDGYLGHESARGADGFGITVSYWRDEEAIASWREHARHRVAQRLGRDRWYDDYVLRVARVERAYGRGTAAA